MTIQDISGRGGGKKGGGSGTNAANTLRSKARASIIDVISEGPIGGLVDGAKSIFIGETPVQNQSGSYNFNEVSWEEHKGYADEGAFSEHDSVGTLVPVEAKVSIAGGAVQRSVVETNAAAVYITIRINSLFSITDDGAAKGRNLNYKIDVRAAGGQWVTRVTKTLTGQKCISPVQIPHTISLPEDGAPWDIRVIRSSPDDVDDKQQSEFFWESMTVLVAGRYTYPHTAAIALEIDAEEVPGSLPQTSFMVRGREVEIPSNYDPVTRAYVGIWNGLFQIGVTSNPAWMFRDMIVNDRFGLGEFVSESSVNKWTLYTIARHCDELVQTGYKDTGGSDIMEPRYTFNGVIRDKKEAMFALQMMTQSWRGMGYWSLGQVFATADMPSDPVKLVSPANVIGGSFSYSSTATKARHSVVMVTWKDPSNFYRNATEAVIDDEMVRRFGWREKSISLDGCTSRGQARRHGRWVLDVERYETETVTYNASLDHMDAAIGEIVSVADPRKAAARLGGRVVQQTDTEIMLDAAFTPAIGETYKVTWTGPDGKLYTRDVESWADGNTKAVTLSVPLAERAVQNATYVIVGTDVEPRSYRILGIKEVEPEVFAVTALFHDPLKYQRVERGIVFEPIEYTRGQRAPDAPTNLIALETNYIEAGVQRSRITVSWTPPINVVVRSFVVRVSTPNGEEIVMSPTETNTVEFETPILGEHTFDIRTMNNNGVTSEAALITVTASGPTAMGKPAITTIILENGTAGVYQAREATVKWSNLFPSSASLTLPSAVASENTPGRFSHSIVEVRRNDNDVLLRTDRITSDRYTYTLQQNVADNLAASGAGPTRAVKIKVVTFDIADTPSDPVEIVVTKGQVSKITPVLESFSARVSVAWNPKPQEYMEGAKVWIETTSGFDPSITAPKYEGASTVAGFTLIPLTSYFVRVAGYDLFGADGLNYSDEFAVDTLADFLTDNEASAEPGGLSLSSAALIEGGARLTAAWNAVPDIAHYEVQIKQGAGNFISYLTSSLEYIWPVISGQTYTVSVRAVNRVGRASIWSNEVVHVAAVDAIAPATTLGLVATGGFDLVWLTWDANTEQDLDVYHIYESATTTPPVLATSPTFITTTPSFIRQNLTGVVTRNYWVRAVDLSGNAGDWSLMVSATTTTVSSDVADGSITTVKLEDGAVTAAKVTTGELLTLSAQIKNAIITDAKIANLSAAKLTAGTALTSSLTVDGTALSTIQTQAGDPAARVNAASTQIDPGKILISGTTSLSDWRTGGDETKINGGAVAANTIAANALQIGSRNLSVKGIEFEFNSPGTNEVSWTAGSIVYQDDAGVAIETAIASGSVLWASGTLYICWDKGGATLVTTTTPGGALTTDRVILATYEGASELQANYGRTVIDGSGIKTGSVTADRMSVSSLSAVSGVIGTLASAVSGERIVIETDKISVYDATDTLRVRIGNLT